MPFFWIFPLIFFGFVALRLVFGWGWCGWRYHPAYYGPAYLDPKDELKQRLARGDITVEEYEKRRQHL